MLCGVEGRGDAACAAVAAELASGLGMGLTLAHVLERSADVAAAGADGAVPLDYAARLEHTEPLRAALLGSTSSQLVRASRVPVVVCPRR